MIPKEPIFLCCPACSNKFLLTEAVVEIPLNDVPGGIPYVDREDGKLKIPPHQSRRRMFKCTKCGRGVAGKLLTAPSKKITAVERRG